MFGGKSALQEGRSVAVAPGSDPTELTRETPSTTRTVVADPTEAKPGTVTVDTANRYLYLSMAGGQAMRYDVRRRSRRIRMVRYGTRGAQG